MSSCVKCGWEIQVGVAFCPNCGAPVTQVVATSDAESALFGIDAFKGLSRYLLVFTDKRLIVALARGGIMRLATLSIVAQAYEELKLKRMMKEEIEKLLSDRKTYIIPYSEVGSMEVDEGGRFLNGAIAINRVVGETERFRVYIRKRIDDFEKVMRPILKERLVIKR